jgi:hypothetical protein
MHMASPHYKATVTKVTQLWNDQTRQWVYKLAIGTVLEVRGASYSKGGVACYPVVGPAPYQPSYYVPQANVRLTALPASLLTAWTRFCDANPNLQQFGQADDETTFNGATGCTHTILQVLIKAATGRYYTHDQISAIAGYPSASQNPGMRGLYSGGSDDEAGRVIRHFGLPYQIVFGWSWSAIVSTANARGPVMYGIRYGYWPEWKGYHYHGEIADGYPNGFAALHGKTQLYGFESGYHAVLKLGSVGTTSYDKEPNHGSTARPEKPGYDRLTIDQGRRAYVAYSSTGRSPLAWVPTKVFRPKGY